MTKLPSDAQCAAHLRQMHVPGNIVRHCLRVNSVAQWLATFFPVNAELVDKASLLHDLFRIVDVPDWQDGHFDTPPSKEAIETWTQIQKAYSGTHEEVAYAFFAKTFPVLAQTIRGHKFKQVFQLKTTEQKLLTYADKRCKHDTIVSLSERFRDGRVRNRHFYKAQEFNEEELSRIEQAYFTLEKELFAKIGKNPEHIEEEVARFMETHKYHDWRPLLA